MEERPDIQILQLHVGIVEGEFTKIGGELSLVLAPYADHGRVSGTVGVLGPTRMDYAKVMPLVDATASAMSEALSRSGGGGSR